MTSPLATLFDRQTQAYASARPDYPAALFEALAALAPSPGLAWDCGCGSGQASVALTSHFARVLGTDVSATQLASANPHPQVTYLRAPAAHVPQLHDRSVDLITVATAVHWFDLPGFYAEAARVLRPGGVLAIWAYSSHFIAADLDAWTATFSSDILGPYWRSDRLALLRDRYTTLPAPAPPLREVTHELEPPASHFSSSSAWAASQSMTLARYADYLRSWSASQAYRDARGEDPVSAHMHTLASLWGHAHEARLVTWPLFMRLFRLS